MNALPNLPQFECDTTNVGVKWQKWVLRFENFLVAYDINTDARKKALLLHFAGPTVHAIYETLSPATIGDNYADTLKVLNDYFLPKGSSIIVIIFTSVHSVRWGGRGSRAIVRFFKCRLQ